MKTTVIESGKTNGVSNKIENTPAIANSNSVSGNGVLSPGKSFDTAKVEAVKEVKIAPQVEAPKVEKSEAKTEPSKVELRDQMAVQKPTLNLESTLKLVEELHRRKIQRDKLIGTIDRLDEFEVAQINDAEETDSNHFQRCELTIEDDQRREFVTKNPLIIKKVAQYIHNLCVDRLAEIEGEIFLPA